MTTPSGERKGSIRAHLTRLMLVGAGFLVAALAITLNLSTRSFLTKRNDGELFHRAQGLMALVQQDKKGIEFDFVSEMMPEFESEEGPEYFELWLPDGSLLSRSNSLADQPLSIDHRAGRTPSYANFDLAGKRCRLLKISFLPQYDPEDEDEDLKSAALEADQEAAPPDKTQDLEDESEAEDGQEDAELEDIPQIEPVTLLLLRDRGEFDRFLDRLEWLIYAVSAVLLVLLIVLVRLSLRRGLKPLDEISAQVRTIQPKNLETRVHLSRSVAELNPVVEQLNGLLDRLEAASQRERRFTSDVAHELRTPLAELRTLSEVAKKDPDDLEAVQDFFRDVHDIALEMQTLVTNLLELSRCDSGVQGVSLQKIDFADLISNLSRRYQLECQPTIRAASGKKASPHVISDPVLLEQTLRNLLQNAISHGTSTLEIRMDIAIEATHLVFRISNPAPGLTEQDLTHLFERFWQKDPARTSGKNAGLGLSLVECFCQILGIRLNATLENGRLEFQLEIPKAELPNQPT